MENIHYSLGYRPLFFVFFIPAGDLGGGGSDFEFMKVVVQQRHSISLNSTNKVLFAM